MPAKPVLSTTQDFTEIEDVGNDLVLLSDGSVCLVIEVAAINFGLFSEKEQEATIYAYAQMINSLTFSIQIVITSKRKDITDYLKSLDDHLAKTTTPLIKDQLIKYRDFVKSVVRQSNVLDKKFYVSIPFSSLELGIAPAIGALGPKKAKLSMPKDTILERAATNLNPKRDHLIRMMARIGLRAHQLNSQELVQLFYELINRESFGVKVALPVTSEASQNDSQ
jgi:hypothetical protein